MKLAMIRYIFLLVVLLTSCARLDHQNKLDRFQSSTNVYAASVRWAQYHKAVSFHVNQEGETATVDLEELGNYRVTRFNIISRTLLFNEDDEPSDNGSLIVEIDYYHKQHGTVKKIKLEQSWWFEAEKKRWFTSTAFPIFESPF